MMIASMIPAMADAQTFTLTMPTDSTGFTHTYDVYQIFTGDLYDGVLSNVQWGSGSSNTGVVAQNVLDTLAAMDNDAQETAVAVNAYADGSTYAAGVAAGASLTSVPAGYYLIKDASGFTPGEGDEYSLYIVKVVGDVTITRKANTTTSTKDVAENNDSSTDIDLSDLKGLTYGDYADYDIGDEVPFKLTATITDQYDNYKIYHLTFHDEQCEGLTFNASTVKVYVGDTEITEGFEVVTTGLDDDCAFEVVFANLKEIGEVAAGSVISVYYTSTLNSTGVVYGNPGNPNTSHVEYSNNPNDDQGGEETGDTPDDTTVVFTYKMDVDKIVAKADKSGYEAKTGAGFTLYKKLASGADDTNDRYGDACTLTDYTDYYTVDQEITGVTNFEFDGLDAGDYLLVETTTPDGYNTMDPLSFSITRTIAADGTTGVYSITALNGPTGYAASPSGGEFTFTRDKADGSGTETVDTKIDGTTDELGSGEIFGQIENKSGATLPSTGGIGTTIFYVAGSIMVLAAAILLITKRRMGAND